MWFSRIPPAVDQTERLSNDMLTMINDDRLDVRCIWFPDEAHFPLDGSFPEMNRFGLQYPAKASLALFSYEKRSLLNGPLQYFKNCYTKSVGG